MAGRALRRMTSQARSRRNADVAVSAGQPCQRAVALIAGQQEPCSRVIGRPSSRARTVMAIRTRSGNHGGMVVERGKPGADAVAGIARGTRFQRGRMAGRPAGGERPVVALRCARSGGDSCVIEERRHPGIRPVALLTRERRLRSASMARRLTSCGASVVAGNARTGLHAGMIEMRSREPDGVGMAYLARIVGDQMVGRHRDRIHPAAPGMTTGTATRRPLEHRARMACNALQSQVCSSQGITCLIVREILLIGFFGKDLHRSE